MDSRFTVSKKIQISFPPKAPIKCELTAKNDDLLHDRPLLIFTHGSGGNLSATAMVNFVSGVATMSPILCFQGNMNLSSRTAMFKSVCENQNSPKCLGGRSMGARAAVMAATKDTTHLVLVSYPLHTAKDSRDQILLDLQANVKVIFISGDKDTMCEIERLQEVRKKMKCKTWLVIAKEADHGMNLKPKTKNGTNSVGMASGEIMAAWLGGFDTGLTEATLSWQAESEQVQWSGWEIGIESRRNAGEGQPGFEFQIPRVTSPVEVEEEEISKINKVQPTRMSRKRKERSGGSLNQHPPKKVKP